MTTIIALIVGFTLGVFASIGGLLALVGLGYLIRTLRTESSQATSTIHRHARTHAPTAREPAPTPAPPPRRT